MAVLRLEGVPLCCFHLFAHLARGLFKHCHLAFWGTSGTCL